jgi:hypothetical protein
MNAIKNCRKGLIRHWIMIAMIMMPYNNNDYN